MQRKQYKALILDMDGTLLDSRQMVEQSFAQMAEEFGFTITRELARKSMGSTTDGLMEEIGLPDPKAAGDRWREIMLAMDLDGISVLYDGVDAVLAAPIRRGLVTSQTGQELAFNLKRLGIADRFEFTVSADDTPHCKPHPRPLLHCLEQMGLAAGEALFVGDSSYDCGCAEAAGVDFGLAAWGAEDPGAFPSAAYIFSYPGEMLDLIARGSYRDRT